MEPSLSTNPSIPVVVVLYDFRYMWRDNREIAVKKGEKLLLLEKTNKDWWQVVRPTERKSFFVPAQYVDIFVKGKQEKENYGSHSGISEDDSVLYENLDSLKQKLDLPSLSNFRKSDFIGLNYGKDGNKLVQDGSKQKPVPKTRTKVTVNKSVEDSADKNKLSESDSNLSQYLKVDSDKYDKGDKFKIGVDNAQDFVASLSKDLSVLQGEKKNFKCKGETVAVENKVYCNVPVGDKNNIEKQKVNSSVASNQIHIDGGKNRMKNSYNLKTKPIKTSELQNHSSIDKSEVKRGSLSSKNEKLLCSQKLSNSLEKLAEEIQFEPKKVKATPMLTSSVQSKSKSTKMPKDNPEKKTEKKGKTADASVVLNEKIQPQPRSMFSRFRRSLHHSSSFKSNNLKKLGKPGKKICELSLSWEGGLDKIQEKKECEEKPQVTPLGLQRSRTFMFAERSPLAVRPANKIFRKHRLDAAYYSQRKPDEKVTFSTFKPICNIDITNKVNDIPEKNVEKEFISRQSIDKDKILTNISESIKDEKKESKNKKETESFSKVDKKSPKSSENKNYPIVAIPENESNSPITRRKGVTLCSEPYSNSESDDNLEEKSLTSIANKALRSQSSIDSNITASEGGTEASDSDENSSLEFILEERSHFNQQSSNKKRSSLVRNSRVESSKVRKITARLPSTPPLDQKPLKDLGDGWGQYISKGGRCYYYNENTGEKNWKPPRKSFEKPFIGSRESISSDANRSSTSSPLNENHLQNSLKGSDGFLHSKSAALETSGPDVPKFGSVPRWKEDSLDDVNRSSYNSSPITGLSQSSYSLNKSSRDSLNLFSPVDNIPSEEEGFELSDHVYQDDHLQKQENKSTNKDRRKRSKEVVDTSAFCIRPGWEEFYDENLDQIYYVHKGRKEKWILSFDSEERAYFFEETTKKSLWALPDYSGEGVRPETNFLIQKSATESAINNETESKLRQKQNDGKSGRISASTRSSKTQSMLIEPKFDISSKNGNKTFSMPRDLSKIFGEIIRLGILNKTKICENGKKLRKNWTPAFVVLSESYLFFFKDAKSFQNMKNVISSTDNHMCLTLQGAVIEKGDKISSRKNVYKISSLDNVEVLIQTEKTAEAEEWFKNISSVIQKLPREPCGNRNSPLLDANSPSKVGRTKSVKVRNKETGSMEDLTSTPEERQNKIKARLKKFFIRRPTVDSLKKKGIWKDEPVFGCSLEHITKNRNPRVPIFVEKCIECIESKEENMKTDGLYRASGNLSQVQKIRLEVDQNNLGIMKDEEDVHVLTGSLKLFFRELKEPLIPSKQLEPALLATDKQVRKERIKDFQKIVKSLPTPNHDTLKFLLQHLLRVKEYHKFNRMNINNLAIVFGPTLMWPEQESTNMALELMQQNVVIECLLKEFYEIFT